MRRSKIAHRFAANLVSRRRNGHMALSRHALARRGLQAAVMRRCNRRNVICAHMFVWATNGGFCRLGGSAMEPEFVEPIPIQQIHCKGLAWHHVIGDSVEFVFYQEQSTWIDGEPHMEKVVCARILVSMEGAMDGHRRFAQRAGPEPIKLKRVRLDGDS